MNITLCDRCGKKLGPLDSFTMTLKAGEYVTLRHMNNATYDLCADCVEVVKEAITKGVPEEKKKGPIGE